MKTFAICLKAHIFKVLREEGTYDSDMWQRKKHNMHTCKKKEQGHALLCQTCRCKTPLFQKVPAFLMFHEKMRPFHEMIIWHSELINMRPSQFSILVKGLFNSANRYWFIV